MSETVTIPVSGQNRDTWPTHRRIAGPLPYLLENKLDEERAKKFDIPITFEILTGYTGTMADVKYQGMFDQADQQDRNALRQLIEWCTLNCYMLLLYQAAE